MFVHSTGAVAGVVAAQQELAAACEALARSVPDPWQGPAATAFAEARELAVACGHGAEAALERARECAGAFEHECATWAGLPFGGLR